MSTSFIPDSGKKTKLFRVTNPSEEPIALELTIAKRIVDLDGEEKMPEVEDDFMVFPDQLILKPGQKRTIKVTWTKALKPKTELSYRLIAEQLPIDVARKKEGAPKANIKILMKYIAAIYVSPPNGSSKIQVSHSEIKNKKIDVYVENKGTKHQSLKNLKVILSQKGKKHEINDSNLLKGFIGANILASSKRRFRLSIPKSFNSKDKVAVEIKFD